MGLGGVGVDGPAVWAVGNMGECNQVSDGDGAEVVVGSDGETRLGGQNS